MLTFKFRAGSVLGWVWGCFVFVHMDMAEKRTGVGSGILSTILGKMRPHLGKMRTHLGNLYERWAKVL